jgi:hypothetical protein
VVSDSNRGTMAARSFLTVMITDTFISVAPV